MVLFLTEQNILLIQVEQKKTAKTGMLLLRKIQKINCQPYPPTQFSRSGPGPSSRLLKLLLVFMFFQLNV